MSLSRREFIQRLGMVGGGLVLPGSVLAQSKPSPPGNFRMSGGGKTTYVTDTGNPVANGTNLQAALDAARPGDVVLLHPGATYLGNLRLPVKEGTRFIVVKSSADESLLPPARTRTGPSYSTHLAKIAAPGVDPALATVSGTHHWRFENIEFVPAANGLTAALVQLGSLYASEQGSLAQVPHDLAFDRVLINVPAGVSLRRGIGLDSARTKIVNSYIAGAKSPYSDAQAILGINGPGPFLIDNNYLEGSGENVMFGGGDPAIVGLVPSDITFTRNHCAKPWSWRESRAWSVKNLFELKNAQRVRIEGNLFENNWSASQVGWAILFNVRNQDGTAPWSTVRDVIFRNNVVRHATGGINLLGIDNYHPSVRAKNITITNNLIYDIDGPSYGSSVYMGGFLIVLDGVDNLTVEHNTVVNTGTILSADGEGGVTTGLVYRNNYMRNNAYGIFGSGYGTGISSLEHYFPGYVVVGNVIAGGLERFYPAGNFFPEVSEFDNSFVDPASGNYRLVAGSRFQTAATDGTQVGADLDAISAASRAGQQ